MVRTLLFLVGISLKKPRFLKFYNKIKREEFLPYKELKRNQDEKLRKLISYCYNNVPFYHDLFNKLNLKPENIQTIEDLQKLPILDKKIIRKNWDKFIPKNLAKQKYFYGSTGGSTGEPFKYRISIVDDIIGTALLYTNYNYLGYKFGDKFAFIGGASLLPSSRKYFEEVLRSAMLNMRFYSSFDMSDEGMYEILKNLREFRPKFIKGYSSSLYLLAMFMKDNNQKLNFTPKKIFTTAEVLFNHQRKLIEKVFGSKVIDQYSLNDGGVSAYECEFGTGMHIDMVRSVFEVTNKNGKQLSSGQGMILATSLYNFALPFIRYDTGDLAILSKKKCKCGKHTPMLSKIIGRVSDFIVTPTGNRIHGEFFSHTFRYMENGKMPFEWVKEFQIVQKRRDELIINIIPLSKEKINTISLNLLKKIILNRTGKMKLLINITNYIKPTKSGKWQFIVNKI